MECAGSAGPNVELVKRTPLACLQVGEQVNKTQQQLTDLQPEVQAFKAKFAQGRGWDTNDDHLVQAGELQEFLKDLGAPAEVNNEIERLCDIGSILWETLFQHDIITSGGTQEQLAAYVEYQLPRGPMASKLGSLIDTWNGATTVAHASAATFWTVRALSGPSPHCFNPALCGGSMCAVAARVRWQLLCDGSIRDASMCAVTASLRLQHLSACHLAGL